MLRNPSPVMSCPLYPIRRRAAVIVFSLIGRDRLRTPGNANSNRPVSCCKSRKTAMAWVESGTMCCTRIFMRSAGIRHCAFSKSNSAHCAARSSPGRTKTSGDNRKAQRVIQEPSYASIARSLYTRVRALRGPDVTTPQSCQRTARRV